MSVSDLEATRVTRRYPAHLKKVMAQGEDRFESAHHRKDGSTYPVEVSVQYQPNSGGGLVVFLWDITVRKRAEEELRASELRHRLPAEIIAAYAYAYRVNSDGSLKKEWAMDS